MLLLAALCAGSASAIGPRAVAKFVAQPNTTQASAASGEADVYDNGNASDRVTLYFSGLVPDGYYSVFSKRSGDDTLVPLDGSGDRISFTSQSSGTGYIEVLTARKLASQDQIVLVYHSDGKDYGVSTGPIGVTAYALLVAVLQ